MYNWLYCSRGSHRRIVFAALIVALLAVFGFNPRAPVAHAQGGIGGCPVFPANNWWNRDISNDALDPNSANYINSIGSGTHLHPDFGSNPSYGIPYITVSGTQPKVPITFTAYGSQSDPGPYPMPLNIPIEGGSDRHAIAVDTTNCKLYELFAASQVGAGFNAGSGAVFDLRSNQLRPDSWTSADAAGLPIFPGLVRYDEVQAGVIAHALRFTVQTTQQKYIHPATHYASSNTDPNRPPMGLRLRMKASYNINGLTGASRIIATAMKKYGLIVADNGSNWFFQGATDSRWNDDDLDQLKGVPGSAFEVVKSVTPVPPEFIGAYKDGFFYLRNSNTTGPANIIVNYGGAPGHRPLVGDWNGDGIDTLGVYDTANGAVLLRDSNTFGPPNYVFTFGNPGDAAYAGHWDTTTNHDGVGVYRNSNGILYLRNTLNTGFADYFMIFGNPGDSGFAGDWDGDRVDSVGVYRPGTQRIYLSNKNGSGVTYGDLSFPYNFGSARPVVGDWKGDGFAKVSYFNTSNANFTLITTLHPQAPTVTFAFGPAGAYPIAGRWVAPTWPDASHDPLLEGLRLPNLLVPDDTVPVEGGAAVE